MKTSTQWWRETKSDPKRLARWLLAQYHGEEGAAVRIGLLRDHFASDTSRAYQVLSIIMEQEREHASWVKGLLVQRGVIAEGYQHSDRYWGEALTGIEDLETGCAVGAHAEKMRLARIRVIANDPEAPSDIRDVFQRILPQEIFHERAFRSLSSQEALQSTKSAHARGANALGLVP
jgi:rubrerythrin